MARRSNWPGHTPLPKGLSAPARRALAHEGIETLEQLVDYGEKETAALHGIGPTAMAQLQEAMDDQGLSFNPS
ncbi:hypothetical protein [Arthrobacter sp. ISL-30]|jgi:hypothetical protein|uniref:hypothetical protein n=1 Tax=Arthrobacter sp. ISL-30 TaxID=2819109 RepID=UPI001BE6D4D2|nr:hypothetical protein [Arthrobacter sp. ISL-30]MBT2512145.1 hypothetical protein [Arthrobacter sp. ISL-30]